MLKTIAFLTPPLRISKYPSMLADTADDLGAGEHEKPWVRRYDYLLSRGYKLDDRYSPNWKPSWAGDTLRALAKFAASEGPDERRWYMKHPDSFTDSLGRKYVKDAVRMSDGVHVVVKIIKPGNPELDILRYLSSNAVQADSRNPTLPIIEAFSVDPADPLYNDGYGDGAMYIVLPLVRDWRLPSFVTAAEALDFMQQLLESLVFLHEHKIAHRDIRDDNILQDPSPLFPDSQMQMNPMNNRALGFPYLFPEPAITADAKRRYLLIDYGNSVIMHEGTQVTPVQGEIPAPEMLKDDSLWEVDETKLYDPFKADVYALGTVFLRHFGRVLPELIDVWIQMRKTDPAQRPSAAESLRIFANACEKLPPDAQLRMVPNARIAEWGDSWPRSEVAKERLRHRARHLKALCKHHYASTIRRSSSAD
ncbi:kinase-like protein [Exidia glandulosa HHB12029]|uniref:Kinase-like protein n=1 Tax=Exidia glandulosa HHB12029 TaxID=1314781 RepID=A0A165L3G7_EXIGL|nr:kinase-like protein [Exidia glandulosa HHB12029]